ncbi:MAG TPA: hypothetical protein DDW27_02275, partial [Bacteroidales bacterium]|nr:hypothetical protein [Bacteroidales bacterium]
DLIDLLNKAHRRSHITGTSENGIIAALDLEGRLFTVINGIVINRVVPFAIKNRSNRKGYLNPGGDALWPAPEGTCYGYEYATGKWRVPPSITSAVWEVISDSSDTTVLRAEIDLVNNLMVGIPCEFERHIKVTLKDKVLVQEITELIRYIGKEQLDREEFRIAPWSLCQFDSGINCMVIMEPPAPNDIWDIYSLSNSKRGISDGKYVVDTQTDFRFQLGIGKDVKWIQYNKGDDFSVKRFAGKIAGKMEYIDISDISPDQMPSSKGVNLSIYCDPSGFMEIEACGGCPEELNPGTETSVTIITEYQVNK